MRERDKGGKKGEARGLRSMKYVSVIFRFWSGEKWSAWRKRK